MSFKNNSQEIPKNNQTTLNSSNSEKKPTGLVNVIGNFLPLAPLLWEQWTGQKVPQMTGTVAEINTALSQLTLNLTQVLQNQQQLWTKLESLEKSASSQLSHLTGQIQTIQSLRLTHSREKKEIELQGNVSDFDKSRQYSQPRIEDN